MASPEDEFTRSYSTPIVVDVDGQRQIVVAGALTLTGYDLKTGDRRWWLHGLARIVNTTPVDGWRYAVSCHLVTRWRRG